MSLARPAAEALARDGMAALRSGDGAAARAAFERIAAEAVDFPAPWLPLAQAARLQEDAAAEAAALDLLLADEPRHLAALLMMASLKARIGDDRAATAFYRTAHNVAATLGESAVAPALAAALHEGKAFLAASQARFEAHLTASLAEGADMPRVGQALDLLLGRTELYLQQPSMFYFPGLPQRAFYAREEFDWAGEVEAATGAIREELQALLDDREAFAPYVLSSPDRPRPANPLRDDPSWGAAYLWRNGAPVEALAERCPAAMAALGAAPMPIIAGRSPMALFSRLAPGTHIRPHHGLLNTRLICHLPLIVPEGCGLRVGAETRAWREGALTIFDDSIEHEAWNRGAATRTVLLFEIWRPEIAAEERVALARLFEAIDAYQGPVADAG